MHRLLLCIAFVLPAPASAQSFAPMSCTAQTSCLVQGDCRPPTETILVTVEAETLEIVFNDAVESYALTNANLGEQGAMSVFSFSDTASPSRVSLATFDYTSARLDLSEPENGDQRITVFSCVTHQ